MQDFVSGTNTYSQIYLRPDGSLFQDHAEPPQVWHVFEVLISIVQIFLFFKFYVEMKVRLTM